MLVQMHDVTATSAMQSFSVALNRMPLAMHKSMIYDLGREMARHTEITQKIDVAVYLRHVAHGSAAATKTLMILIRQYLPKGTDLSKHSQEELDAIVLQLNMRPRKRFDFRCPIEMMGQVMQEAIAMRHDARPQFNNLSCTQFLHPPLL